MTPTSKILNELYTLQAFGEQVKQKATSLINMMEGEVKSSPKINRKKEIAANVVMRRNIRINKTLKS